MYVYMYIYMCVCVCVSIYIYIYILWITSVRSLDEEWVGQDGQRGRTKNKLSAYQTVCKINYCDTDDHDNRS